MKSLLEVTLSILDDVGMQCGVNPLRDASCITRRVKDEGQSFLTITLPSFASALERALDEGCWSASLASSFRRRRGSCLPRFLSGFSDQIFDATGSLLKSPSADAIRAVRQVCRTVSKQFMVCSRKRTEHAADRFLEIDSGLGRGRISKQCLDTFNSVSDIVWSGLASCSFSDELYSNLRPRHGPGTTAEGTKGNQKYLFLSWPSRVERLLPFSEFGISSILNQEGQDRLSQILYHLPRDEQPVKVCFVPKTASKPRVIAIEPVAMQYMQQAIADWLRKRIETRSRFTAGHVNFRDQSVNANFARSSSKDGKLATLDMSDASDRVSCKLVWNMLRSVPELRGYIFATRSTRARLPDGRLIPLRKFASMGSALCFPIESMVFFIAMISARLERCGLRPTPRSIHLVSRDLFVYGDDLIVPTGEAPAIIDFLERFDLVVNRRKSFWTGRFRESCGSDFYDGVDVTPVYLRYDIPTNRADVRGLVSLVSFANQCYWSGLWGTARKLRLVAEKLLGKLPSVDMNTQALGWQSFSNALSTHGWNKELQRLKTRCYVPFPISRRDPLDGDAALLKCWSLIGIPSTPVSLEHLLKSVRYGNLALKRRWI